MGRGRRRGKWRGGEKGRGSRGGLILRDELGQILISHSSETVRYGTLFRLNRVRANRFGDDRTKLTKLAGWTML